jgi:hypothetical protein
MNTFRRVDDGCDPSAFFLGRPCQGKVVGKLRAPQRAGDRLLKCRETGEQRSQHFGVLQHRLPANSWPVTRSIRWMSDCNISLALICCMVVSPTFNGLDMPEES